MGWENSTRAERLPSNWYRLRESVRLRANGRCEALMRDNTRCPDAGAECDHVERGDNHDLSNLQWLCKWHHNKKTQQEAAAARAGHPRVNRAAHPRMQHPGLR